jgi:hypothetical protein
MTRPTIALCALLPTCTEAPSRAANADTPGDTGRTVIPGDNSTLASDVEAPYMQRNGIA